jgi:putative nucleotidyltransferase with HDIG domain
VIRGGDKITKSMVPISGIAHRALKAARKPALALLLALVLLALANTAMPAPALGVGTVAPLDAWPATPQMTGTTGDLTGTFTISDGIDRLLVVLVCSFDYGGSSGQTFTATYGGKTLTQTFLQNSNQWQTWIGYLRETDIASRAGDAVTVTVTGTHTQVRGYVASYSGVDRTTPVTDSGGTYIPNLDNQPIGGPLDVNAGGYGIYGWSGTSGKTRSSDTGGYIEHSDVNNLGVGQFNYGVASLAFAGTGVTNPVVDWSSNNSVSVSFITLNPASSYPAPATTGISPATKTVGDAAFTLTVDGANFVNGASVVRLDGADRATTFVSSTRLTAAIPASDLSTSGNRTITVFTPAPGGGTSNAQTLAVRTTPVITWANPAAIVYGTALSATQLCATASVPGTFVYSPDVADVLPAGGGQTLHVDFMPTDTAIYNSASADVTINVSKAALTITANSLSKNFGNTIAFAGIEFTADGLASGDTVNGVTLTSVGAAAGASVDGSPYIIVPSGAVGTGLGNYNITYANGSLAVTKANAGLSLTSSVTRVTDGRSVTFTVTVTDPRATGTVTVLDGETTLGSSALVDGTATCTVSALAVGGHSITATYSGDANFAGSTSSPVDLAVEAAAGFNWALIGWIVAAVAVALFFLLVILLRRRKRAPRTDTISRAMGVVFNDTVTSNLALSTVEEVSTYPIQLERELEKSIKRVEKSMEGAVQAICRTVETKDPYVAAHQKRVSQFACTIAKEMGLTTWQVDGIRVAGLLHDIGKVTVPTEILTKPGKLSKIEMAMIKDHPRVAFDILKNVEFDWPIARMVVQHHERMDGSGYPDGIKGEDILLEARILAVADVVEAMCTHRPYRPARGVDEALVELARGEGTLYDPEVVRACKKVLNERGFKVEFTSASA